MTDEFRLTRRLITQHRMMRATVMRIHSEPTIMMMMNTHVGNDVLSRRVGMRTECYRARAVII